MQDLRLVAANENGTHLVLRSPGGDKYLLSIDDRLRAAVRGDRARLGQLEIEQDGKLRPRDIQARIRAGATAEQVAASAGVPVERVRRFEGPVLAEREHMAQMAQRGAVRRAGQPDVRAMTLADTLAARLDPLRIQPDDLGWDSWRRDDGRWLVQLAFEIKDDTCRARFLYDPRARTVCAENDEGRWLVGELDVRPTRGPFVPRLAEKPADDAADEETADATGGSAARNPVPASIRGDHPAGRRLPEAPVRRTAPETARPAPDVIAAKRSTPDVVAKRPAPDVIARQAPAAASGAPATPAAAAPPVPTAPVVPQAPAAKASTPAIPPVDTRPRRVPALDYLVPPVPDGPDEQPTPARREPANRSPARRPGIRADVLARPQRRSVMDLPPMSAPTAAREEEPAEERRTGTHDGRGLLAGASSGGRSRRASVPSWDDILFGTRRRD